MQKLKPTYTKAHPYLVPFMKKIQTKYDNNTVSLWNKHSNDLQNLQDL